MRRIGGLLLAVSLAIQCVSAETDYVKTVNVELRQDLADGRTVKDLLEQNLRKIGDLKVIEVETREDLKRLDFKIVLMTSSGDESDILQLSVLLLSNRYMSAEMFATYEAVSKLALPDITDSDLEEPINTELAKQLEVWTYESWRLVTLKILSVGKNDLESICQQLVAEFDSEFFEVLREGERAIRRQFQKTGAEEYRSLLEARGISAVPTREELEAAGIPRQLIGPLVEFFGQGRPN